MNRLFTPFGKKDEIKNTQQNNNTGQWQSNNNNSKQSQPFKFTQGQWQQQSTAKSFNPCTCPRCGANLWIEDGIDTFFCQYCGYKILSLMIFRKDCFRRLIMLTMKDLPVL